METVLLFDQASPALLALASARGVFPGLCGYAALSTSAATASLPPPTTRAALPAYLAALAARAQADLPAFMDDLQQHRRAEAAAGRAPLQDLPGPHAGYCPATCRACYHAGLVGVEDVERALRTHPRLASAAFQRRLQGAPHGSAGAPFVPASAWEQRLQALEAPFLAQPCRSGACCYIVQQSAATAAAAAATAAGGAGAGGAAAAAPLSCVSLRDFAAARMAAPAPLASEPIIVLVEEAHYCVCLGVVLDGCETLLVLETAAAPASLPPAPARRAARPRALRVLESALDAARVQAHTRAACARPGFLCEPSGVLKHPYICPGGFYSQLWDWDSVFAGIGALPFGGGRFLLGSCLNFLEHTTADGRVPGCLTPKGPSTTLAHAKPVIIQGALLGARALGAAAVLALRAHRSAMEALLAFWERERLDAASGLYTWHDQMESGADDLPYADVPSAHTPTWNAAAHERAFSAPDVQVFLYREHIAFAQLLEAWAGEEGVGKEEVGELAASAARHRATAARIAQRTGEMLWHSSSTDGAGYFCAFNTRTQAPIPTRTYQLAWPLWEPAFGSPAQRAAALAALGAPDMRGAFGIRSTSSACPRYELADAIVPYSIWRGPVWMNVNFVLAYAMARSGAREAAVELAEDLLRALAGDLARSGAWHECYHPDTGTPLSRESKGFLSWTVMAAGLLENLEEGVDPTAL